MLDALPTTDIRPRWAYPRTAHLAVDNGVVILYSDAHYWPGEPRTPAFRALVALTAALQPKAIIANGDLIDGAKISRHGRIAWSRTPGVFAEIKEMQARQNEIRAAAPPRCKLFRTIGNHDIRFDNWLAQQASDFEGVPGMRLSDHLPDWPESWSVRMNKGADSDLLVKHRWKGGIHAMWNNVAGASIHMATGHTHRGEARSFRGYRHRLWGIETGTLAVEPQDLPDEGAGPFEYAEDAPASWTSGFVVLTFHRGVLLRPEFCSVENGNSFFRGHRVSSKATAH